MLKSRRVENGSLAYLIIGLISTVIISILSYEFMKTQTQVNSAEVVQRRRLNGDGAGALGGLIATGYLGSSVALIFKGLLFDGEGQHTDIMMGMSGISMLVIPLCLFVGYWIGGKYGVAPGLATAGIGTCVMLAVQFGVADPDWVFGTADNAGDGGPFFFMMILIASLLSVSMLMNKCVPGGLNAAVTICGGVFAASFIFKDHFEVEVIGQNITEISGVLLGFALLYSLIVWMRPEVLNSWLVTSIIATGAFGAVVCKIIGDHNGGDFANHLDSAVAFFLITFVGLVSTFAIKKMFSANVGQSSGCNAFAAASVLLGVAVALQLEFTESIGYQCFTSCASWIVVFTILWIMSDSKRIKSFKYIGALKTGTISLCVVGGFATMTGLQAISVQAFGYAMGFGCSAFLPYLCYQLMSPKRFDSTFTVLSAASVGGICAFGTITSLISSDGLAGAEYAVFALLLPLFGLICYSLATFCSGARILKEK